jgi:hypothetical protein
MGAYHALATPLHKQAALPLGAIGRSLMSRGLWGTAARGGQKLAQGGGRYAALGGHLATGASAMRKASPYLAGYGIAGMVADPLGYNLPGSSLAFNVGAPGWGALITAPSLIRSGRLATGNYNDDIERDARSGAQLAGRGWIQATQQHAPSAYDPGEYVRFLQANGIDTESAGRYLGGQRPQQPGMWRRIGNAFENPTGNVVPEVQQRIYDNMFKGASYTEKNAFWGQAARLAGRTAWQALRGQGKNVASAGWGATKANLRATAPGQFLARHPGVGKWGGRALTTGMIGLSAVDGYDAITSDKPYDEVAVQQEGYDGAQAAIRDRLSKMTPFQRRMAQFDPSLSVHALEQQMPGTIASWEQASGSPYQPGILGGVQQAWQGRGTPSFYSFDGAGNPQYIQ